MILGSSTLVNGQHKVQRQVRRLVDYRNGSGIRKILAPGPDHVEPWREGGAVEGKALHGIGWQLIVEEACHASPEHIEDLNDYCLTYLDADRELCGGGNRVGVGIREFEGKAQVDARFEDRTKREGSIDVKFTNAESSDAGPESVEPERVEGSCSPGGEISRRFEVDVFASACFHF